MSEPRKGDPGYAEFRARRNEYQRKWRSENPEKQTEYGRRWRQNHPEVMRRQIELYYERHPEKLRASQRRRQIRQKENGNTSRADKARRHGADWQTVYATLWDAQGGRCYLCGDPLVDSSPQAIVFDHDHSCCPQRRSCPVCRRGLACGRCNKLVGLADEDPSRLFRIASALRAAQDAVQARMTLLPSQQELFLQLAPHGRFKAHGGGTA